VAKPDKFLPIRRPATTALPTSLKDVFDAYKGKLVEIPKDWDPVEKNTLVGKPFAIHEFTIRGGDYGEFVTVFAVTEDGQRIVFSDGSTGIAAQLLKLAKEENVMGGISVLKGLRVSNYTYKDEKGVDKPAATYYLT
jgi:hypothetical protein